jgi:molybdopterin converting factor small subunit
MVVKLHIPQFLHDVTDGAENTDVIGSTVGECLGSFINQFPGTAQRLLDKDGGLLGYVDVYLNGESIYPEEMAKPVADGDELMILLLLTGG